MQREIMLYAGIAVLTITLLFCIIGTFLLYDLVILSQLVYSVYLLVCVAMFRSKLYAVLFATMIIMFAIMDRTYIFKIRARICQLKRVIKKTSDESLKNKAMEELCTYEKKKRH